MLKEKEPLSYRLNDLGYGVEQQKRGGNRDKRNGRRKRSNSSGGDMEQNTTVVPSGGTKYADTFKHAARSTGNVLRDDVGHPLLRGAAYGFGATAGAVGALFLGQKLGINPLAK